MRPEADLVVIGAGIMGLSVAYNLAALGGPARRITVLEASYLCSGASGRNGGGVRAQWANELSVRLMKESLGEFASFARRHRINTWFRQGGYLFLARSAQRAAELERSVAVQRRAGLDTELMSPAQVADVAPEVSSQGVLVASYNANDAVVFPWPFVWGYAEGARALGVEIETFTRVTDVEVTNGEVRAVHTDRGSVKTPAVLVACGALSPAVARMAGVELPTHPHRHEICSSEPLKPFLTPLVADLTDGLYFSQSTRGEIVGGISDPKAPTDARQDSSARFLALYARALVARCPRLASVGVLRQWAGLYDISPDQGPILGAVASPRGLYLASGFMGHGFMMAPVVGKRLAELIAKGRSSAELDAWRLSRFEEGRALAPDMIIG
ncbi:MAG: FAD-binding oxidoreductase [Polyangiaceae bacterium]